MKKPIHLNDEKIIRLVESQTSLTRDNSNIVEALEEAKERNTIYQRWEDANAEKLIKKGKEPYPCCNMVCKEYKQFEFSKVKSNGEYVFSGRSDYCNSGDSHRCMFQMSSHPPNSLDYDEYMPSHIEALDMLEKHGLLKGDRATYQEANCKYDKAKSQKERNQTEISGITFAQIYDCILEIVSNIPEFFNPDMDEIALCQNMCVEIEKAMGIYPNIKLR